MSEARRIALRGGIVFALGWPLLELANRAALFPSGVMLWWVAGATALAAAASCCCGAILEKRRARTALLGGVIATLVCSTFMWLQGGYAYDVVQTRSVSAALVALWKTLDSTRTSAFDFAVDVLRGGLGVAWVTWGRARWPGARDKPFLVAIAAAVSLTIVLDRVAASRSSFLADPVLLRFGLAVDLVVVSLAVLAPAWADALERRLAARAET